MSGCTPSATPTLQCSLPQAPTSSPSPGGSGMRTSESPWTYTATCSRARTKPPLLRWIGSPLFGSNANDRQYIGSTTAPKTASGINKALRKSASEGLFTGGEGGTRTPDLHDVNVTI